MGEGTWVPILHNVARAEAYLRAKFYLDSSNRMATIHQRYRQTGQIGQTEQRPDNIGRTVLQTVAQKADGACCDVVNVCDGRVVARLVGHSLRAEHWKLSCIIKRARCTICPYRTSSTALLHSVSRTSTHVDVSFCITRRDKISVMTAG